MRTQSQNQRIVQTFVKRCRQNYKRLNQRLLNLKRSLNQSEVDQQKKQLIGKFYPPSVTDEQDISQYQKTLEKSIPDFRTYKKLYPMSGMKQYDRFRAQYMDAGFYKWIMKEQIKQRQMGNDPRYVGQVKQDCAGGVGGVAGFNRPPKKKLEQDGFGNYAEFNHPVMNSKGEGINKGKGFDMKNNKKSNQRMGQSGMAQQKSVYQRVQFDTEDQNFMPTGRNGYGDDTGQNFTWDQEQNVLSMPRSEDEQMFDALIKGEQEGQYEKAERSRDDRDIERLFDERSQPTGRFQHGLPPRSHPVRSEQRTMHSDMRAWQQGVMPLEATGTDKPILSQGMDARQMYDLMEGFMIQQKAIQRPDFTNKYVPGLDPGYDVR